MAVGAGANAPLKEVGSKNCAWVDNVANSNAAKKVILYINAFLLMQKLNFYVAFM
jgi:hypothetical protein